MTASPCCGSQSIRRRRARRARRTVGPTARCHSSSNDNCGDVAANTIAEMRSARHRFAVATALFAYLAAPPTTFAATALRTKEELSSDLRLIENHEKDSLTASNDNSTLSAYNRASYHKCYRTGRPRDENFWQHVMGSTFILNAASSLLCMCILISKRETNQQRWCFGVSIESTRCIRATVLSVSAISSMAISLLTAHQVYVKASKLMMTRAQHVADVQVLETLLAFFGFLMPIVLFQNENVSISNLSTVTHEGDCSSCDTICKKNFLSCKLERRSYYPRDESTSFVPPSHIVLRSHGSDGESMSIQSRALHPTPTDADHASKTKNATVWLAHFFIHGVFVGAAAIVACPCDDGMFFLLICTIALSHGIHLERKATVPYGTFHDQHERCWTVVKYWLRFLSLLTLGGLVSMKATEGRSSARDLFAGGVLASAGGAYINMALFTVLAEMKRQWHWIRPSYVETVPMSIAYCSRRQKSTQDDKALTVNYTPCPEANPKPVQRQTPSKAQPIPQRHLQHERDSPGGISGLASKYDWATWRMYARIASAREARARYRCALCLGSMDEDEEAAIVTVGGTGRQRESKVEEERRLARTCPCPLYHEVDDGKEAEVAETSGLQKVHQECYYGATEGHLCPHRKNLAVLGESLLFPLEL